MVARTPEDLAADAARALLAASGGTLVRIWLRAFDGAAPRLVASAGDAAFAPADDTLAVAALDGAERSSSLVAYNGVTNARIGLPVMFAEEALGYVDIYADVPIGFARAADVERLGAHLGSLLGAVFATAEVESPTRGKIVVADDDPQIRSLLVVLLQRRGFECVDVPNGLAAYEAARREKPDLVLIDWMMPVMDGRETVERLKNDEATRHIPVVMLTGQSQIDDKVSALEAGVQDFITKPFDSRELVARVEQQMKWRRLLADLPAVDEAPPTLPAGDRTVEPPAVAGDVWTRATDAVALGRHDEALTLFLHEAETSEEKKRYPRAAIAYRSAAVEAAAMQRASLANKLLRLAGKMYLSWSETAEDARAIQDGYLNAARCFLAAGNLKLAKKSIDFASSYESVISDVGPPPVS